MNQPASHLARYVAKPATSDAKILAMGAKAYREHETLVVRLSQIRDPVIRQMAATVADYLFGRMNNAR